MQIRLCYTDSHRLFGPYEFSLDAETPDKKSRWIISPLFGKSIRLESDNLISDSSALMCRMAVLLGPAELNKPVEAKFTDFIQGLSRRCPETISDN